MNFTTLILSDDLIDASKVIADARHRGETARQCKTVEQLQLASLGPDLKMVVIDLQHPELDLSVLMAAIRSLPNPIKVVAFGSHVDAIRLKAAREAGCDEVFTRSQFLK